jgi:alkylated DNA nucleotide flippase Atl1
MTLAALLEPLGRRGGARRAAGTGAESPALEAIWHAVCTIPRGRVSTYGAVARAAGLPGRARQAGYALRVASPSRPHRAPIANRRGGCAPRACGSRTAG